MTQVSIIDAINDPHLFKPWFKDPASWRAWVVFHKALFGLEMTSEELKIFQKCTHRKSAPTEQAKEAWMIIGRRGGKSFTAALIAVFLACFFDYKPYLAPGEHGTVALIAQDRKQARVLMRYISGLLNGVALLKPMVDKEGIESIELTNEVDIEIHTSSFRAVRGYTVLACICDEIAYWRSDESANPDHEVLNAIRPAMATIPNAILLCLGSPYSRRGAMWDTYNENFGKDTDILVWQADTRTMNPAVDRKVIDRAYRKDPVSASAEYGAQFRTDVEEYISLDIVDACVVPDRFELPYIPGVQYFAFCDPSGGSSDSMTLAISHKEKNMIVLDCIRERKPPFSPDQVVREFADTLGQYHVKSVTGDRYGGEWPRERFRVHGITYQCSERTRSQIYLELIPILNSAQIELLDNKRLTSQLLSLERKTGRSGKDMVDHPPGGHDDVINAAAGAIVSRSLRRKKKFGVWGRYPSVAAIPKLTEEEAIREYINETGKHPNRVWLWKNGFYKLPDDRDQDHHNATNR